MLRFPETLLSLTLAAALVVPAAAQTDAPGQSGAETPAASAPAAPADANATAAASGSAWPGAGARLKLGREALPEEIAAWDTDVRPDGQGLPEGEGDVATGEELFSEHCASCHGEFAEGVDNWPKLAGGKGTLADEDPLKTVGSYWPHLSTAWDYVHRSMPFGSAQTMDANQTYALVAYILYSNDLVDDDFVLNRETFASVKLPNADGFIEDDRDRVELPVFTKDPCMTGCKDKVEVTRRAVILDVTPGGPEDGAQADDPAAPRMD